MTDSPRSQSSAAASEDHPSPNLGYFAALRPLRGDEVGFEGAGTGWCPLPAPAMAVQAWQDQLIPGIQLVGGNQDDLCDFTSDDDEADGGYDAAAANEQRHRKHHIQPLPLFENASGATTQPAARKPAAATEDDVTEGGVRSISGYCCCHRRSAALPSVRGAAESCWSSTTTRDPFRPFLTDGGTMSPACYVTEPTATGSNSSRLFAPAVAGGQPLRSDVLHRLNATDVARSADAHAKVRDWQT